MTKHISHGPAAEAVKGFVHLYAGRVIVVKGAPAHAAGIDGKPISLCRLPGCDCLFDLREVDHGDSFLLCFWEAILPGIRKASTPAKSGNGGAVGTIRVDFLLFPDYNDFINLPVFGRNTLKK